MKGLTYRNWKTYYRLLSVFILMLVLACKTNVNNEVSPKSIIITIAGDEGIKVATENTIQKNINAKWKDIQSDANKKITSKDGYNFLEWRLGNKKGDLLTDEKVFTSDTVIFALSKKNIPKASYKVEHWKQNIENDEYKKEEEEAKTGEVGKDTEAIAKTYEGFKAKAVSQAKIKADGSTIVKIEYERNITSIILDLDGGKTTTHLEAGNGNQKLLKGKFEAKVEIEKPRKQGFKFVEWKPSLPEKFLAENDGAVYKAEWEMITNIKINITGDERLDIEDGYIDISLPKTFGLLKNEILGKVKLKNEWNKNFYGVYDFRLDKANGQEINDDFLINDELTIYVRTNYTKFNFENDKLKGYDENEKPRGSIIIPKKTTSIEIIAFKDCNGIKKIDFLDCSLLTEIGYYAFRACEVKHVDLSACKKLNKIGKGVFYLCQKMRTINFLGCEELNQIGEMAFGYCSQLDIVDLSQCKKLSKIEYQAFEGAGHAIVTLPEDVQNIVDEAFGTTPSHWVKKIIVPNNEMREKVIKSGYPRDRIEVKS